MLEVFINKGLDKVEENTRFEIVGCMTNQVVTLKNSQAVRTKKVFFAGLAIRKDYISFYFMPVVGEEQYFQSKYPELMRFKKGKYTFRIRQTSPILLDEIKRALSDGYRLYRDKQIID